MSGYAENCALCKFLHSKFWCYTSAGSIPYSWSLYINARRLMPSIKAVRVRFPSCCSSTSIMMRFSTRLISSFKLRSPTGAVFYLASITDWLTNLWRKILRKMIGPEFITTARSITLESSRIFPGHDQAVSSDIAIGSMSIISR